MRRHPPPEASWQQAFKRRRIAWLSTLTPRVQARYRLLDLHDDVLLVIFRKLLPPSSVLRGRSFTSYRDASNFAFTCRRLTELFHIVRVLPYSIDAVYHQHLSPVANSRFFRSVVADTRTMLRELHLPPFPACEMNDLVSLVLSSAPCLRAFHLTDDGRLSFAVSLALADSPIRTLHILEPREDCILALADEERRVFMSTFREVSTCFFREVYHHFIRQRTVQTHDACRGAGTHLILKPSKNAGRSRIFPVIREMLESRLADSTDSVTHVSALVLHRLQKPQKELSVALQTSSVRPVQYFLSPPNDTHRFSRAVGVLRLDLSSLSDIEQFLTADQRTKTRARYRIRATSTLCHIRSNLSLGNVSNFRRLCRFFLTLFSCSNQIHTLEVSREFVAFAHLPIVPRLLLRLRRLKMICLRNPVTQIADKHPSPSTVCDDLFLDRLPLFIDHLQRYCESFETITMESCFPRLNADRTQGLRRSIENALDRIARYENQRKNVDGDGLRRSLLAWIARIELPQQ
ncbi:hypothetical protein BWQ96_02246 [Gracilariopsis chorda]|uniref:Uncharacterized protein n=1 Tax=Gracilariopsis chorda TaxID=448386 RepID=A0A2V3J397_9FLOR|nr:hypothetical protein BWQ96_02246 [Gracilariopsis chorda]|eukprot:PXF47860.1 hypothetical protein BWQ96_02246 [Gracilariopsis chorda]